VYSGGIVLIDLIDGILREKFVIVLVSENKRYEENFD